jgi:hypothetical protein
LLQLFKNQLPDLLPQGVSILKAGEKIVLVNGPKGAALGDVV